MMKIYMQVTKDEYELPLAVATNPAELSRITGKSIGAIQRAISRHRQGIKSGFVKVVIDDTEEF